MNFYNLNYVHFYNKFNSLLIILKNDLTTLFWNFSTPLGHMKERGGHVKHVIIMAKCNSNYFIIIMNKVRGWKIKNINFFSSITQGHPIYMYYNLNNCIYVKIIKRIKTIMWINK